MNRQAFIRQMDEALARLNPAVRKDILADFEEHFTSGLAAGQTEEDVARELGDPIALAAQYTEGLPEQPKPVTATGVMSGVLAGFALILFDCIIALPVAAVLLSIWISLWAVAIALLGAAVACFVAPFMVALATLNALAGIGTFMIGIALLALAALAGIGMVYVSKWFFKGLAGYVMAHVRIIRGGARA